MVETENKQTKKGRSLLSWLLWWKIEEGELNQQVDGYNKLDIAHSARGISFLLLIFSAIVQVLLITSGSQDLSYVEVFLFLILGYLIFRGKKWAMITTMIFWTIEKAYSLYLAYVSSSGSAFWAILFWVVYMHYFYLAYKVEASRKLLQKHVGKLENQAVLYCEYCGHRLDLDSKYCINCGKKIPFSS